MSLNRHKKRPTRPALPVDPDERLCMEGDAFHFAELMTAQPEATQAYFRARLADRQKAAEPE